MAMDIKKIGSLDSGLAKPGNASPVERSGGPSFHETLSSLDKAAELKKSAGAALEGLRFSNHAVERMRSRGVSFTPEQMSKLESAVRKAAEKGGRDSLVLINDTAVIVSVKNNTIVTVVDKASLKENVFTNIDSTIVV
jgi:flagellar operon protein